MNGFCVVVNKDVAQKVNQEVMNACINPVIKSGLGKVKTILKENIGVAFYDYFHELPERYIYQTGELLVVADAEIYNYKKFEPQKNSTNISEAKIIADLYLESGLNWYKNVQGVFSVFIYDFKKRKGFSFTDRIRTKPLVYSEQKSFISVATNIKSIAALPGFIKELDYQAIFSYISMEMIPTPYTIYKDVKKLESGHVLKIDGAGVSTELVWKMEYPTAKISDEREIEEKIYEITKRAILEQTSYRNKPEEIGAFLSGGTDSSTIAGLINELYPGKAKTFSIGFDEKGYDEMYYARIAAKTFNTQHTEYYITIDDIVDSLPKTVQEYDEPFANSSVVPAYFCSRLAAEQGVKTMLGGDGGDEIFGGNARYHQHFADFQKYPTWMIDSLWPFFKHLPRWANKSVLRKVNNHLKRSKATLADTIHAYNLFNYTESEEIFEQSFLKSQKYIYPNEITQNYLSQADTAEQIDKYLFHDLKITLMDNDLPKVNRMTHMANINIRYPFLYPELVEFTGLLPTNLKVKDGQLRYIFKKSFNKLLPDEIINKTKHGFGLPIVPWMLRPGKLNDILKDVLFDSKTHNRGIFKKSFIEKFYKLSLKDKTPFYGTYLYYILFFELWLREHFDNN